jgi:hypothetical protein
VPERHHHAGQHQQQWNGARNSKFLARHTHMPLKGQRCCTLTAQGHPRVSQPPKGSEKPSSGAAAFAKDGHFVPFRMHQVFA